MAGTVHIVGAGLAGLAAAEALARDGVRVVVYEAAPHAGGRCRSYHDAALGMRIDNGNHLMLSGNKAALDYAERIGGAGALHVEPECAFPFMDLRSGERWTLRPNAGRLPRWVFDPARRVPNSRAWDYLAPLPLFAAGGGKRLGDVMRTSGPLYERLWHPVLLAALNTDPAEASASLAARLMRETFGAGGNACRPVIARDGLGAALVDPAVAMLERVGTPIRFGSSLRQIEITNQSVNRISSSSGETCAVGAQDIVILAVPAPVAASLLPDLRVPTEHRAIVNAHFGVRPPPGMPPLIGLVGGLSEWVFAFPDRLSVTISGADRLSDVPREDLARTIWNEVARVAGLPADLPPWQIVREKRATFRATPEQVARRPKAETAIHNLFLAGDWTDTGLPATIEGAVRSGRTAAALALSRLRRGPLNQIAA